MRRYSSKIHLGWFFIVAVVVPSLLLSGLAIRAINREEAYIEKQLKNALLAEINHAASLVQAELRSIKNELDQTYSMIRADTPETLLPQWKQKSSLVEVPFLLSSRFEIIWPVTRNTNGLNEEERFFLKWNTDFFKNRETTPVYENIALAYKNDILKEAQEMEQQQKGIFSSKSTMPRRVDTFSDSAQGGDSSVQAQTAMQDARVQQENDSEFWGRSSQTRQNDSIGEQYAASQFEQYEPIRKKVYQKAESSGHKLLSRNISFKKKAVPQKGSITLPQDLSPQSIFISESLKLSEITSKDTSGIIPRLIADKLNLLFWKKDSQGRIVGCMINQDVLINRIINVIPKIYSPARILTILNENGRPLITPNQTTIRDWRTPFVATEIHQWLPRWEMAAYLTNPNAISSQAQSRAFFMWILILILLVSIVSGGSLVFKSLNDEIRLAQQKTTFAANVSHELKTPLTSIRMFTEILKEKRQPDEQKQQKYLGIMLSETERLTRLINNVLDFSRRGEKKKIYQFKRVDISELCRTIVEGQRMRLEYSGFTVIVKSPDKPLFVQADEEAIKQVLLNILSNAEKYSTDQKEIDVEISESSPSVFINIKDRGVGIAPKHGEKIFEEFYRIDDSITAKTRGTGLGLTIALGIARDHGGNIIYSQRKDGGSVFQIKLPLA